ncbi:MAG: winged helix-turn-helix transcriptional regulator [Candidatus Aenigmarchaeota archaeon]|nr:winged helix-turn-helix transcriptional regulator [Candidatus Aenigmarchaeota archaeon]
MNELSYRLFFKAFSNKTRFEIIRLLRREQKSVTEICKDLNFEQSRVSHNLKCLEACGFVSSKWNGKNKIYSLDKKHILSILDNIDKHIERYSKRLESCGVLKNKSCGVIK